MQLPVSKARCRDAPELCQHQVKQVLVHGTILESINLNCLTWVVTTNSVVESTKSTIEVRVCNRQTTTTGQKLRLLLSSYLRLPLKLLKLLLILILAILARWFLQPQHWHTLQSLLNLVLSTSTLDHTLFHLLHVLLDTLDFQQIFDQTTHSLRGIPSTETLVVMVLQTSVKGFQVCHRLCWLSLLHLRVVTMLSIFRRLVTCVRSSFPVLTIILEKERVS